MGYSEKELNTIYDKTSGYCHLCRKKLSWTNYGKRRTKGAWHVDHSRALANGGTHHMNNLFPACISCNEEKGTYHKNTIRKRKGYHEMENRGGCYITTACVRSKGLSDDCKELQVLRNFRDTYVASMEEGAQLISEYYKTAPLIVQQIDIRNNADEIYCALYSNIKKAVLLVEHKMHLAAFDLYCSIVRDLKKEYLTK